MTGTVHVLAALGGAVLLGVAGIGLILLAVPDTFTMLAFSGLYAWVLAFGTGAYVQAVIRR